jgi:hypothetical protein
VLAPRASQQSILAQSRQEMLIAFLLGVFCCHLWWKEHANTYTGCGFGEEKPTVSISATNQKIATGVVTVACRGAAHRSSRLECLETRESWRCAGLE